MKKFLTTAASLLLVICFFNVKSIAQSSDEKMVRAIIQKAEDAWNADDFSFAGKYDIYAEDAVVVNPVGMYWKNRSQIVSAMQRFGPTMLHHTSTKHNIKNIRFLAPAVALVIVHSIDRVEQDYTLPNGAKGGSKGDITEGMCTYTLVKKEGNWKIAALQVTAVDANAAPANPFRDN
jgi:uncharacterized protein (TIGR02246 family)